MIPKSGNRFTESDHAQRGGTMAGKPSPTHEAPYRGLRVLDFGQGVASPYAAMLLGVYGAEIIKVEPPEGDWSRFLGTTYGNHTTLSAVYNRGKRSLCLDMKHRDGVAIARPDIGQDSCEVLLEAGLERSAIDDLIKAGAVRVAKGGEA